MFSIDNQPSWPWWSRVTCATVLALLLLLWLEPPIFGQVVISDCTTVALLLGFAGFVTHALAFVSSPGSFDARYRVATLFLLLALLHPKSPLFRSATWWFQTYVLSPRLHKTSHALSKIRVVPNHRLIFCAIEKNANTAFEDLLCSLSHASDPWWLRWLTTGWVAAAWRTWADFELPCMWAATHPDNQGLDGRTTWNAFYHKQQFSDDQASEEWISAVFIRDPLERFLSGWLSKCTPGHDLDREVCTQLFGAPDASFARAVEVISSIEGDVPDGLSEDHFRLQSVFCNGTVGRGEFDYYFLLDRATSRQQVAQMLAAVGINNPSDATRAFDYHFPPPPPEDTAEHSQKPRPGCVEGGGSFDHVTDASRRLTAYYSSPELVRGVLRHYAVDYRSLPGLRVPEWAVRLVGEEYVRSLWLPY